MHGNVYVSMFKNTNQVYNTYCATKKNQNKLSCLYKRIPIKNVKNPTFWKLYLILV